MLFDALGRRFEGSEGGLVVLGRKRVGIWWLWEEMIGRGSCVLFPHFKNTLGLMGYCHRGRDQGLLYVKLGSILAQVICFFDIICHLLMTTFIWALIFT